MASAISPKHPFEQKFGPMLSKHLVSSYVFFTQAAIEMFLYILDIEDKDLKEYKPIGHGINLMSALTNNENPEWAFRKSMGCDRRIETVKVRPFLLLL